MQNLVLIDNFVVKLLWCAIILCMTRNDDFLDCGDNSCVYALERKGMRTNGGCRCLKDIDIMNRDELRQMARRIQRTFMRERRMRIDAEIKFGAKIAKGY